MAVAMFRLSSVILRVNRYICLPEGRVARVVAANVIPDATPSPEFLRKLEEMEPDPNPPKRLTIKERQKLLLELLRKEGLPGQVEGMAPGTGLEI